MRESRLSINKAKFPSSCNGCINGNKGKYEIIMGYVVMSLCDECCGDLLDILKNR